MRIRQRDPDSQLWSMCEVRTFASQGGARTSICVEWLYMQASFVAPSWKECLDSKQNQGTLSSFSNRQLWELGDESTVC